MVGFEMIDFCLKSWLNLISLGVIGGYSYLKWFIEFMKNVYDVFKKFIKLLDIIIWMDRVVGVILWVGDELEEVRYESENDIDSFDF